MSYDITLAGQGYMLVPGSYRSLADTPSTPISRQRFDAFSTERLGAGVWPAPWPVVGAVGPGPLRQPVAGSISASEPKQRRELDVHRCRQRGLPLVAQRRQRAGEP
jgi:hypothetical protein